MAADFEELDVIERADILVSYTCNVRPSPASQQRVRNWVERGGRFFALHGTNSAIGSASAIRSVSPRISRAATAITSAPSAGNFDKLAGGLDTNRIRRVYLELATKSLNNYFPPRTGYGGLKESDIADERSWLGVTRIYEHASGQGPQDELGRFAALFAMNSTPSNAEQLATRFVETLGAALNRWAEDRCDSEDVRLLNEALAAKWLPNEISASVAIGALVAEYRAAEKRLQPDRTIGSADDWNEARDEGKAGKGKMDPTAACGAAKKLVGIETEMAGYMTKNKEWCNIPDNVVDGFKQARAKTQTFATQACAAAVKMKQMQEQAAQGGGPGMAPPQRLPAGPL